MTKPLAARLDRITLLVREVFGVHKSGAVHSHPVPPAGVLGKEISSDDGVPGEEPVLARTCRIQPTAVAES